MTDQSTSTSPPDRPLDLRTPVLDIVIALAIGAYVIGVPIGLFLVCGGK